MAQSLSPESPSFSRLTSGRRSSSWTIAVPTTFLAVAVVVLMAWLAARASSRQTQLETLQRDLAASQQTLAAAQKQVVTAQAELEIARDPGRTTVVMQAPAPAKGKSVARPEAAAWGAAVWGESQGKSWHRISAYGLQTAPPGHQIHVWFEPIKGPPLPLGKLEPAPNGTALLEAKDLPGVDQGKRLFVSLEARNAKAPAGPVLFEASLPKLVPQTRAAPDAKASGGPPAAQQGNVPGGSQMGDTPGGK
ncbi:MAG TPA: anti-sigma factor [Myxococcales bacterium]|nr:anti-sigma factor [Myxococcales bacterium]